jgi:hypothetical protein
MDLDLARRLAGLTRATYAADPATALPFTGDVRADAFATPSFRGLAVSDERAVHLVFAARGRARGATRISGRSWAAGPRTWTTRRSTSAAIACIAASTARSRRWPGRCARWRWTTGAEGKPLYLAGHSAGGALATLAARRLHEAGVPVRGAVVFSSPRVGDRAFAATYPVQLVRIERRHDVVPHLPLPPSLAYAAGPPLRRPLAGVA